MSILSPRRSDLRMSKAFHDEPKLARHDNQDREQHRDDGDDHQQFHQRQAPPSRCNLSINRFHPPTNGQCGYDVTENISRVTYAMQSSRACAGPQSDRYLPRPRLPNRAAAGGAIAVESDE